MASLLRKIFGLHKKKKFEPRKDSITGLNKTFPVPYLSRLEGNQLQPGQSLIVRGKIIGREEFIINLTSGARVELDEQTEALDNRLLSIRVDVSAKRVYLNACIDNEWGKEGIVKHRWAVGDDFDIRVRCHEDVFDIFMEHKLVASFAHYVPISNISHFYINGDVELYTVSWEGKFYHVPYVADIPGNFFPGRKLHVSATLPKKSKQFHIEFGSGKDVALLFTAKMRGSKILRKTRVDETWSAEEKSSEIGFPFKRKQIFDIIIYCHDSRFVFYVDDCYLGGYDHRIPPLKIDKLSISGDIDLHGVHLK